MNNEERLRDALNWLVHLHHGVSKGGDETSPPCDDEWKQCLQEAKDILKATAGPTQMEQLVDWLEEESKDYMVNDDGSVTDYCVVYGGVLNYIRKKYLGGDQ